MFTNEMMIKEYKTPVAALNAARKARPESSHIVFAVETIGLVEVMNSHRNYTGAKAW